MTKCLCARCRCPLRVVSRFAGGRASAVLGQIGVASFITGMRHVSMPRLLLHSVQQGCGGCSRNGVVVGRADGLESSISCSATIGMSWVGDTTEGVLGNGRLHPDRDGTQ